MDNNSNQDYRISSGLFDMDAIKKVIDKGKAQLMEWEGQYGPDHILTPEQLQLMENIIDEIDLIK